ncbi:hypothetical protein CDAR_566271 [Caerostris darwini]|uniref:Uncharacterized protein n=1 Tax=Caerostris darwini TaxID=1538125 RepID=A0AAV4UDK9_9ARAC|nr:hypothetical protein CDAR_566271 [Caerostris darwini]
MKMVGFPSQQLSTNRKESLYVNENSTMNISVLNSKLLDDVCNGSSLHSAIRSKAACTEFAPELRRPNDTSLMMSVMVPLCTLRFVQRLRAPNSLRNSDDLMIRVNEFRVVFNSKKNGPSKLMAMVAPHQHQVAWA